MNQRDRLRCDGTPGIADTFGAAHVCRGRLAQVGLQNLRSCNLLDRERDHEGREQTQSHQKEAQLHCES